MGGPYWNVTYTFDSPQSVRRVLASRRGFTAVRVSPITVFPKFSCAFRRRMEATLSLNARRK